MKTKTIKVFFFRFRPFSCYGSGKTRGTAGRGTGSGCFSACVVVVSCCPQPLREERGEDSSRPPARLQNRIYAGVVLRVCVSEPCESLLPGCLSLRGAVGLPPARGPRLPAHPHTALLGRAEAPPASPDFRATLQRNRGCGTRWI